MDDMEWVCVQMIGVLPWLSWGHSKFAEQPSDWLAGAGEGPLSSSLSEWAFLRGLRVVRGQALTCNFYPKHKHDWMSDSVGFTRRVCRAVCCLLPTYLPTYPQA